MYSNHKLFEQVLTWSLNSLWEKFVSDNEYNFEDLDDVDGDDDDKDDVDGDDED